MSLTPTHRSTCWLQNNRNASFVTRLLSHTLIFDVLFLLLNNCLRTKEFLVKDGMQTTFACFVSCQWMHYSLLDSSNAVASSRGASRSRVIALGCAPVIAGSLKVDSSCSADSVDSTP